MTKLRVIELFSGIGAQRAALNRLADKWDLELEYVAQCEIDKYAIKAYNAIFGETTNLGDITKVEKLPASDLVTYSFPCTSLSKAGHQKGMAKGSGNESALLWEVERVLKATPKEDLPEWLVMENVTQVHSKKFIKSFNEWIESLDKMGYDSAWCDLNSKDTGVAQNRNRTFMVSRLKEKGPVGALTPKKVKLKTVLRNYLEKGPVDAKYFLSEKQLERILWRNKTNEEEGRGFAFLPRTEESIANCITSKAGSRETDNFIMCEMVADLNTKGNLECSNRVYSINALCPTINTGQGGGHMVKIAIEVPDKNGLKIIEGTKAGWSYAKDGDGLVLGFLTGSSPARGRVQKGLCPTLQTGINVAVVLKEDNDKYYVIRKLTPEECWRLFGRTEEEIAIVRGIKMSDTQMYKLAGNGIVVDTLMAVFECMFGWDEKMNKKKRRT